MIPLVLGDARSWEPRRRSAAAEPWSLRDRKGW
jgi:hypothetical protein